MQNVIFPLLQALVLFACAPLLSGVTRVARARLHNRRGPGVLQEYRDLINCWAARASRLRRPAGCSGSRRTPCWR